MSSRPKIKTPAQSESPKHVRNGIRALDERVQRFVAGDVDPMVMLICGYFRASYGSSIDLFPGLSTP